MARTFTRGLFQKPKNKRLARDISIKSPTAFKASIRKIRKGGVTLEEKRALVLARTRAQVQLKRKNLSPVERTQMRRIANTKLPAITRRKGR